MANLRYVDKHGHRWRCRLSFDGVRVQWLNADLEKVLRWRDAQLAKHARQHHNRAVEQLGGVTVESVVERWFERWIQTRARAVADGRRSAQTNDAYRRLIDRDILPHLGHYDVRELCEKAGKQVLSDYLTVTLTPRMAKLNRSLLNQAFRWAIDNVPGVTDNPLKGVKGEDYRARRKDIPTREEVEKLLLAADEESSLWGLFVRLVATLGLRAGEATALRWEDFDFDRQLVHVRRNIIRSDGRNILKMPKSGEQRTLHLPHPGFWDGLEPFRRPTGYLFTGWERTTGRPSDRTEERCWGPTAACRKFRLTVDRTGLVGESGHRYTLHALRHYVATTLYHRCHDWVQLQKFLGHKSPIITMQLYANHLIEKGQRDLGAAAAADWW